MNDRLLLAGKSPFPPDLRCFITKTEIMHGCGQFPFLYPAIIKLFFQ